MVSNKIVVALIIVAILLSVTSIFVTMSSVNTNIIPQLNPKDFARPDSDSGKISIVVNPQPNVVLNNEK